jgi:hypothetical protein
LAGVHTVYADQHVTPIKPLFADEGSDEAATPRAANAGPVVGSVVPQ